MIFTKKLTHLIDKIITLSDLDSICNYISETFKDSIPHSRMCIVFTDNNGDLFSKYTLFKNKLVMDKEVSIKSKDTSLTKLIIEKKARIINSYTEYYKENPESIMTKLILNDGLMSSLAIPIINNENSLGVLLFSETEPKVYNKNHIVIGKLLADCISIAITKSILVDDMTFACISGFASLVESKDNDTGRHIERMQKYSKILAIKLTENLKYRNILDSGFILDIYNGSALHDIGKVGIPDGILLKQGQLSPEEFEVMKKHASIGGNVLKDVSSNLLGRNRIFFQIATEIALAHHEKYDGSGYPNGLAGDDIPIAARIVAVADVLDALTSRRPYKLPLSLKSSIDIIKDGRGKHFDPDIVDALLLCIDDISQVYELYKDE